jgi:hypothetical protein
MGPLLDEEFARLILKPILPFRQIVILYDRFTIIKKRNDMKYFMLFFPIQLFTQ